MHLDVIVLTLFLWGVERWLNGWTYGVVDGEVMDGSTKTSLGVEGHQILTA